MESEPLPKPEFLEQHFSKVPPPPRRVELHLRSGFGEEVPTSHSGLAISDLDKAFACAVERCGISLVRDAVCDVLDNDFRLGVREHTSLGQGLFYRQRNRGDIVYGVDLREPRLHRLAINRNPSAIVD